MTKSIISTTIVSILYFGLMKFETTQPEDIIMYTICFFGTLFFVAWMIAAVIVADDLTKKEDKKSC